MQYIFLIILIFLTGCTTPPYPELSNVPVDTTPPETSEHVREEIASLISANHQALELLKKGKILMNSIDYYDKNAEFFHKRTLNKPMSLDYQKFLSRLPKNAKILDAGCGGGRDAKYFIEQGYDITAFDASSEMVTVAAEYTGNPVLQLRLQDMEFNSEFDGVWASRSLLHVPYEETSNVLKKIHTSLKKDGIFYVSYKYGNQKMDVDDRIFYNMDETTIKSYLEGLFDILEIWKTDDTTIQVAPDSSQTWLAVICRKKS